MNQPLPQALELPNERELRRAMAKTLKGFCTIYLPHHFYLVPHDYFDEMMLALENYDAKRVLEIGFRGCAKSSAASLAFVLWAALEHPDLYPFIIMLAATQTQVSINAASVQFEMRTNDLLKKDYGHLVHDKDGQPEWTLEGDDEWQGLNFVLYTGVRILARTSGQQIRGLKHRQHRPSLLIADDVEDLEAVRTKESRDKTDRWMRGDVLPSLASDGRLIVIGNWLHTDGLLARLKATGSFDVHEFSLLHDRPGTEVERCAWPAKYPDQKSIDDRRNEMGDIAFRREMLLQIVPEEGQDVLPEDIHYYDKLPFNDGNYLAHGVDLAISTKESADYTTCITGEIAWPSGVLEIYIQPNPLNKRMSFHETMDTFVNIRQSSKMSSEWYVEAVAYQKAAIEEMERRQFSVQAMHPMTEKRARLRVAARYIKNGTVRFPHKGCEDLIQQLLGFGVEKHDDMVDGLVWLILGVAQTGISPQDIGYVRTS